MTSKARRMPSPADIALAAQMACLLEASAPKPGNVSRERDFGDTRLDDFLLSGAAVGPPLAAAAEIGVGEAALRAVLATRRWVDTNTNLGIVLLFAPLARAAARGAGPLRQRVRRVLAGLTRGDAEAAYEAIRRARPGGLGEVAEQDVRGRPTVTLREAMVLAAGRDAIAREYATDYEITFEIAGPALRDARNKGLAWPDTVLETFLCTLAAVPDTLIARKAGHAAAEVLSREAARALAAGGPGSRDRGRAVAELDRRLRHAGNRLNPGSTADLTAAALFVVLLDMARTTGLADRSWYREQE